MPRQTLRATPKMIERILKREQNTPQLDLKAVQPVERASVRVHTSVDSTVKG